MKNFQKPDFAPKPFVWNDTASTIDVLKTIPYLPGRTPSRGITQEEADRLLEWVVSGAAEFMERLTPRNGKDMTAYLTGKCSFCNMMIRDLTQDLGDKQLQQFDTTRLTGTYHYASLLHLPVQDANDPQSITWKHYLIDPTLRQFFIPDNKLVPRMAEGEAGKIFTTALLKNGHAELTEETAKIYFEALKAPGFDPLQQGHTAIPPLLNEHGNSYLKLLNTDHPSVQFMEKPGWVRQSLQTQGGWDKSWEPSGR